MVGDGETSLATALLSHAHSINPNAGAKRRRYRRSKSVPLTEFVPGEIDCNIESLPRPNSYVYNINPSFRRVIIYLILYLVIGTICFSIFMNKISGVKTNGVLDSIYFCIVTMTTVGYGDLVPNSASTKLLACAFVFTGMALIGLTISKGADHLVEKQEVFLIKAMHLRKKLGPSDILKEMENNRVRYKCFMMLSILVVLIIVGTIFLVTVEKLSIVDAFYCVCSTISTLGYGDKSFSTKAGRVFGIFWILTSTICLAQFLGSIAELKTEGRQKALVKWVLTKRMTNVDLEAADMDNDGTVEAAEFVIYKLKEMGKINEEDVNLLLEEFDELDVDQSGTISTRDLTLAQLT